MLDFTHKIARLAITDVRVRALIAGAVLGGIATALASVPDRPLYNLSMAIVMIAAGFASFVCHALHEQSIRPGKVDKATAVRLWVSLLGCGLAASIWASQLLA
jgi:hypothetical protein